MILSTHIMQEVQAICSRVVIINKGKIVADDAIERLQHKATGETVILVIFKQAADKDKLLKISGVKSVNLSGENMENYRPKGIQEAVFEFAVANQLTITSLSEEQQSLEEVFKELTRQV